MAKAPPVPAAWLTAVAAGEIPSARLVRAMAERHERDLAEGPSRGLTFSPRAAGRVLAFFSYLRHWKGEKAGQPFVLEPWQQALLWVLFGWLRADGSRRFRAAYVELPRKNGKTALAAGVALYLLCGDREAGGEVYAAATKRDQARLVHDFAKGLVKVSPHVSRRLKLLRSAITDAKSDSKFEPLGSDHNKLDGLNPNGVVIDELHAHKTREVHDVLATALGARRQPLLLEITTAGSDRESICYERHEYSEKVLGGRVPDDSFYAFVACLDESDPWDDPALWPLANLNLGVSIQADTLAEECALAKETPAAQNTFRRLHLNQWTAQQTRYLDRAKWDACAGPLDWELLELAELGRVCYGGLDLASVEDLGAFVLVFEPHEDGGPYPVIGRYFIPESAIPARVHSHRVPYDAWLAAGAIIATPGEVIDYRSIVAEIESLLERYDVREIAFDRWGAGAITADLADLGPALIRFGQGFASMNAPTKELGRLVTSGGLHHGGHPILRHHADNLEVASDPAGNLKPVKPGHKMSHRKIDAIVGLLMGLDRATRHEAAAPSRSVYDRDGRGLVTLGG